MINHQYKGFWISLTPVYEPQQSRLARGDWRSRLLGFQYTVRRDGKVVFRVGEKEDEAIPPTQAEAFDDAQHRIDVILE